MNGEVVHGARKGSQKRDRSSVRLQQKDKEGVGRRTKGHIRFVEFHMDWTANTYDKDHWTRTENM